MKLRLKRGQITLEYMLFVTVMLLVLFAAFGNKDSKIRSGVEGYVDSLGDAVGNVIK